VELDADAIFVIKLALVEANAVPKSLISFVKITVLPFRYGKESPKHQVLSIL
jgi:hypothetical protein